MRILPLLLKNLQWKWKQADSVCVVASKIFPQNRLPVFSQNQSSQNRYLSYDSSHPSQNLQDTYKFLHSLYSTRKHGVLSTESGCKIFCQTYHKMEESEKLALLCHLSENYGVNQEIIVDTVKNFLESKERGEVVMLRIEERLRGALSPKYHMLFSDIGRIEGGVKFLVDMRADILHLMASTKDIDRAHLLDLQHTLRDILSLWFTVGFLKLERITWQSSCDMLEKISEYEAVHPVRHWQDLKRRVGPYRRCFVFTHSSMPDEPIVVLHCALTSSISSSIHSIIDSRGYRTTSQEHDPVKEGPEDPNKITTAMFYSVSNTQKGLKGVDLGNYLIKKVAGELQHEWPQITQFSSISPIPGFRDWLIREINVASREDGQHELQSTTTDKGGNLSLLTETEIECLCNISNVDKDSTTALNIFRDLVIQHTWVDKPDTIKVMKEPLMRLCARYLYLEKRRGYALNSVGEDGQHELQSTTTDKGGNLSLLTETEIECLCNISNVDKDSTTALNIFRNLVIQHTWVNKPDTIKAMKEPLMRLCARYLYLKKRRGYALNSVANFHLQNGAVLWRLNWLADTTLRGLTNSCGLMVNYRYYLEDTVKNSQQYIEHNVINTSDQIRGLCEL